MVKQIIHQHLLKNNMKLNFKELLKTMLNIHKLRIVVF